LLKKKTRKKPEESGYLDDLKELNGLNGDVELDEAVGGSRAQLFAIYSPRRADDARFFIDVEPPGTTTYAPATNSCDSFTQNSFTGVHTLYLKTRHNFGGL